MSRILVVDDESLMRDFLSESLTSHEYEVDSAENGAKALELMKNESYDVILTDFKMPNATGMDVLRKARDLPVLITFPRPAGSESQVAVSPL